MAEQGNIGGVTDRSVLSPVQHQQWRDFAEAGWDLYHEVRRRTDEASFLTHSEWRLLDALSRSPRLRISDLAERTHIGMSTVSRQVSRLISAGFIEVAAGARGDARQKWVCITPEGRAAQQPIDAARDRAAQALVFDVLSPAEMEDLVGMMRRVGDRVAAVDRIAAVDTDA